MSVWAVIVHYGQCTATGRCLEAVRAGAMAPAHIVVVDNQGDFEDQAATVVRPGRNLGFAAAVAAGAEAAADGGASWVWALNNDALVAPDCLAELVRAGESLPRVGLLSPLVTYGEGEDLWYAGGVVHVPSFRVSHVTSPHDRTRPYDTGYVTGCAPLVNCAMLLDCGPPDESLFMYFEDVEWSLRAIAGGWRAIVVPTAIVHHAVPRRGERREYSPTAVYYITRNRLLLARRYGSVMAGLPPAIDWALRQLVKSAAWHTLGSVLPAAMRGLADGLRDRSGARYRRREDGSR